MTIEGCWYQSFSRDGNPPRRSRLCRKSMGRQWSAAIDLAIGYSEGTAGYRSVGISRLGEVTWCWNQPEGLWWMIPYRVDRRVFALYNAAITCELRRNSPASGEAITRRLKVWKRSGQWRSIACAVFPVHGKSTTFAEAFPEPKRRRRAATPVRTN